MAARGIINGKSSGVFDPGATMTRGEFSAIVVRGLGLPVPSDGGKHSFTDVTQGAWYYHYVRTAYDYGIVNGVGNNLFYPDGTITRQQAAVMVARAAKLCGMDPAYDTAAARDILAQFSDYITCAVWAVPSLAFCYDRGIPDSSALTVQPDDGWILRPTPVTFYQGGSVFNVLLRTCK